MLIRGVIKCTGFNLFMIGDQRHAAKRDGGGGGRGGCERTLAGARVRDYCTRAPFRGQDASGGRSVG